MFPATLFVVKMCIRDSTQAYHIKGVFDHLKEEKMINGFTVGINDDVTHLSLPWDENFHIPAAVSYTHLDVYKRQFQGCIDEDGTLLMPKPKDEIAVTVTSKQEEYTLTLQDENEFCDCLCDLKPQAYTVSVQGNYKVRFEIEGQVFEDVVCIELNGEHVCVNVVVSSNKKADITIQKHIQDADGSLQMPKPEEQFQITLLHNRCV